MILALISFFLIISIAAPIFGKYIAFIYDQYGVRRHCGQNWIEYFVSFFMFNIFCLLVTFLIIYFQEFLPMAENVTSSMSLSASVNAAVSFVTGTFWQSHRPEIQLSMFSQIFALTVQNFISGASGIAVFIAFVRGIVNNKNYNIGNFYHDFTIALQYIIMPVCLIVACVLIAFGVPMDFTGNIEFTDIAGNKEALYSAPVAAQMAVKNLVANGGSIFSAASAHPFESPSRMVVAISLFLVLFLPISMIFTYGYMMKVTNLSWSLYGLVVVIISASLLLINLGETDLGLPLIMPNKHLEDNFNYIGKELIYDKFPSLMWTLSITMSACGSPNACLENYTPLSTLILFSNLIMSKFVIEGVGAGFFAMLSYLIVAVFLRGIITGQTANFFGKKITIKEINYVIIMFLVMPVGVLVFTSLTFLIDSTTLITHHGSQAVTDISYNFASCFANNGSNFTGIDATGNYFNYMFALAMLIGRFLIIFLSLAISGSLAGKSRICQEISLHSQSSLELTFFLMVTVILVGSIMYTPLLILGPLLEFINLL